MKIELFWWKINNYNFNYEKKLKKLIIDLLVGEYMR